MDMEILTIYDENMQEIGTLERKKAHKIGAWHQTIHCWVISGKENGYVLFQKRGRHKSMFPDYLDITAAGHYLHDEKLEDGIREIFEELGVRVNFDELVYLGIKFDLGKSKDMINREFSNVYFLRNDKPVSDYELNPEEVEGLVEMKIPDGLALFSNEVPSVEVQGIEWDIKNKKWINITRKISINQIIPRIDSYYYKIFIMAERYLNGNNYITI